jgi:hypothetical protein
MKKETMDLGSRRAARTRGGRAMQPRKKLSSAGQSRSRTTKAGRGGRAKTTSARGRARGKTKASARSGQRGGAARVTTDLDTIREWAEARGGKPVSVKGTARGGPAGLLRLDFPVYAGGDRFKPISWNDWYKKFKESNLEFIYQERTSGGQPSRFFKLICRGTAKQKTSSRAKAQSRSSRSGSSRSRHRSRGRR